MLCATTKTPSSQINKCVFYFFLRYGSKLDQVLWTYYYRKGDGREWEWGLLQNHLKFNEDLSVRLQRECKKP